MARNPDSATAGPELFSQLRNFRECFAQASEFSTFAFYLPVLFVMVGVSSVLGINLVTMALFSFAAVSGWVGPLLTPKIGHRGIAIAGFGIVLASLLVAAFALYTDNKMLLPFAAAAMLWGHYWDASNCMTIPTMVAKPKYRGTASKYIYGAIDVSATCHHQPIASSSRSVGNGDRL